MKMKTNDAATKIAGGRVTLLFAIFFLIAFGLGYPILNRYDPRQTPGLSDVKTYARLVTGAAVSDADDLGFRRFRVLVPWVARPFYRLARGHFASWDPVMFGLLISDSMFVAGTAVLIVVMGSRLFGRPAVGLLGALLYLANFAVANLRLVGLVDAGEGFLLLALLWSLSQRALWMLPAIAVLGALTKESFVPLSLVLSFAFWIAMRGDGKANDNLDHYRIGVWIACCWLLSVAALTLLQWSITGQFVSPSRFGAGLHQRGVYEFASALRDHNLLYIFVWLLPTAIPNLKRLPPPWLISLGATSVMATMLDFYFGAGPALGRAFFSIAGPVLSLSSAILLLRISGSFRENSLAESQPR